MKLKRNGKNYKKKTILNNENNNLFFFLYKSISAIFRQIILLK